MLIDNIEIVDNEKPTQKKKKVLRVFEAFSGYGSQSLALKKYGVNFKTVGISEIDTYAIKAHEALHGNIKNFGDISKINTLSLPDFDLFTYSFPCQDISMAGKQRGLKEGSDSRSSLLWECQKIIELKRPKFLMMENVKNLVGKKHKPDFDRWLQVLDQLGYNNYYKVINAKFCGIPQNRERVFCVSILKTEDPKTFKFYDNFDSGIRLKDILEDSVDEKYYLSEEKTCKLIEGLEAKGYKGYKGYKRNYECDGLAYCIDANYHKGTSVGNIGKSRRTQIVEKTNNILKIGSVSSSQDGVIVSPTGVSPTHSAGHGNCPKILESNKLNMVGMLDIKGNESIRRVYPSLTTMQGGNRQPKIIEACAIRGRNPENPKSRISGLPTQQMLEVSKTPGINNCLTTVHKDTLLLESQVLRTVRAQYGKDIRAKYEAGEVKESRHNMRVHEPRKDGVYNTLTSVQKDNYLLEQPAFRIRKLTPRECFRLMGVSDVDIDKIQDSGVSNSQQYKMAGNSIVVDSMKFLDQLKV